MFLEKRKIAILCTTAFLLSVPFIFIQGQTKKEKNETTQKGTYRLLPDKPQQYIWGLGFEIQSDAIASGNAGLPQEFTSVPHDLTPSERDRFYKDMLSGFRYCRMAAGLYFRGTTPDKKQLRGRWDTQTAELQEMIQKAGIEGLSLEYWSPAPYWKANGKLEGRGSDNKLRCFGANFKYDSVYKGDTTRFLNDFAESVVNDIHNFEANKMPVKMWGLQNEPKNDCPYSSCVYDVDTYTRTFNAVAPKIKAFNPGITIISDSWEGPLVLAKKINENPETRRFVDAWVWHQIGYNSNSLIDQQAKYQKETYGRPVFQNEYEYLSGGTSPRRCLNTVQNIMNWFTFVNSPTWFWIHALKPIGNAEASGYSLGYWKPANWKENATTAVQAKGVAAGCGRTLYGFEVKRASQELIGLKSVSIDGGNAKKPGNGFQFVTDKEADVYIAVDATGGYTPPADWQKTELFLTWDREDAVYKKRFKAGKIEIPAHTGINTKGEYGIPHLAMLAKVSAKQKEINITADENSFVETIEARKEVNARKIAPGNWVYNNYNWFALAGFLKHMPWNSRRFEVAEDVVRKNQRILAFKTLAEKLVFVITNRGDEPFAFNVNTSKNASFKGYRYTPEEGGVDSRGVEIGVKSGEKFSVELQAMSWDFWVEE